MGKDNMKNSLMRKNGYPTLYYQFLANIVKTKNTNRIFPLPQTSNNAAKILKHYKIKSDFIYIDGSHEFLDVYHDLLNYWDILSDKGIIIGDDLDRLGVKQAVHKFTNENKIDSYFIKETNKYMIIKNSMLHEKHDFGNIYKIGWA